MQTMRLFIALKLPSHSGSYLLRELLNLALRDGQYRYVKPENIHLTLKFLGTTPIDLLPEITYYLEDYLNGRSAIKLTAFGGLVLPQNNPSVIAVQLTQTKELQTIAKDMNRDLAVKGLARQDYRSFNPHITLARAKQMSEDDQDRIVSWKLQLDTMLCDRIQLYESTLTADGPLYTALATYSLL